MTCVTGKICFESRKAARRAHRTVSNKIRVYLCPNCHRYHATGNVGRGRR